MVTVMRYARLGKSGRVTDIDTVETGYKGLPEPQNISETLHKGLSGIQNILETQYKGSSDIKNISETKYKDSFDIQNLLATQYKGSSDIKNTLETGYKVYFWQKKLNLRVFSMLLVSICIKMLKFATLLHHPIRNN